MYKMSDNVNIVESVPQPNPELFEDPGLYSFEQWMGKVGISENLILKYRQAPHLSAFIRPLLTDLGHAALKYEWEEFRYAYDPSPDPAKVIAPVVRYATPDFYFPLLPGNNGNTHKNKLIISPSPTLDLATVLRDIDGNFFEGPEIAWRNLIPDYSREVERIKDFGLHAYMRFQRPGRTDIDVIYQDSPGSIHYAAQQITGSGFGKSYFDYAVRAAVAAYDSLVNVD